MPLIRMIAAGIAVAILTTPALSQDIGEGFRLTATDGRRIGPDELRGRPYLLFFGFTHCPEICPMALSEISLRLADLGPDGDRLVPVFVTVDPARDTAQHLRDYLEWFDPRILGLTGTEDEIQTAARAFRATYHKVPLADGGYTMDHTAAIMLMDAEGGFFGHLDYRDDPAAQLGALRALLALEPLG